MADPKKQTPGKASALRRKAEAVERETAFHLPADMQDVSPEEAHRVIHELRVHQIELEMQNEELRRSQVELNVARERYFDLYDLAPVGYCTISGKGLVLEANLTVATLLGVPRSALVNQPFSRFILKADQDIYYLYRKQIFATGTPQVCEFRMQRANAAPFWVRAESVVAPLDDEDAPACRIVLSDITARMQAEAYREMGREILQILNGSEAWQDSIQRVFAAVKARTGFDAVGIRLQDGEDFPYFVQQGFTPDFLLKENTLVECRADGGVCRGKDGNVSLECTCGLVLSGKTDPANPLFTPGGSFWTNDSCALLDLPPAMDPRLHPRNQCIHQGYASVVLVPIRSTGRIVGLIQLNDRRKGCFTLEAVELLEWIAAHLGEALMRKQAEGALRESEESYRNQFAGNSSVMLLIDPADGAILDANAAALRFYGYSRERLLAMRITDINTLPEPEVRQAMASIVQGKGKQFSFQHRLADGSVRDVDVSTSSIQSGARTILHSIIYDITERKQAEAEREVLQAQLNQAQKMESVGRLAGGVAHDFNNMLGVILGHAELASMKLAPDHPLQVSLQEIRKAADHSASLTRQLLAFARKQTIAPKVLDPNDVVGGMLKMIERLIGENVTLTWRPGANLWPVKVDALQIDQILANLCVNARDAIDDIGAITIGTAKAKVDAAYCADHPEGVPGEYVKLTVGDNGCGMDSATMAHLFEPFFTTKAPGEGTGLGLATVYGAVKQNHGFIDVHSEPGQGTTFSIYLPRYLGKPEPQVRIEVASGPAEPGHETILLVEDEPAILEMTKTILEGLGYAVVPASTPGKAIRLAREHVGEIHLLMTDVVMPEMNGRALAKHLMSLYPELRRLFMSGYTADVIAHHGILEEGVHFIQKPFSINGLSAKIREALMPGPDA